MEAAIPIGQPARCAKLRSDRPENDRIRSRLRWLHRRRCPARGVLGIPPPTEGPYPESDSFLACPAKNEQGLAAARTRRRICFRSRLLSSEFFGWAL